MKTLVFGASTKPQRYSYTAINRLRDFGHEVVAIGLREGLVADVELMTGHPDISDIHTITMYLSPPRQGDHIDYLLGLSPQRIIFNPGTENEIFAQKAREQGIEALEACTLVLLSTGQYELMEKNISVRH